MDLFLGSDIGEWVLRQVEPVDVRRVFALDAKISELAKRRGIKSECGDVNEMQLDGGDVALCVHYPCILKKGVLDTYQAIYNIHPGLLPWGRGFYPVFWALWDQTPAGATIHEMSSDVDAGPIVDQIEVPYTEADTGGSLLKRVRGAERDLFCRYYELIRSGGQLSTRPQPPVGSYHSKRDFERLKHQCDWRQMTAIDLVRLIRCLTHSGYPGLTIELGGLRFELLARPVGPTADESDQNRAVE